MRQLSFDILRRRIAFSWITQLALLLLSLFLVSGCATHHYEYVLAVNCEGRPVTGKPSYISHVGQTPPVNVAIACDGNIKHVEFDPMGETKTIRFSESSRAMIDGGAILRGFAVRIQRPGYKDWTAEYKHENQLMQSEDGTYIRLDSILLMSSESTQPSHRLKGGPEELKQHE